MDEIIKRPARSIYQSAYFKRMNANPVWRAARLARNRAYNARKKATLTPPSSSRRTT